MALRLRTVDVKAVARPSRSQVVPAAAKRVALGVFGTALLSAAPARAEEADAVDATVAGIVEAVKATGQGVKGALDLVGAGVKAAKDAYEVASPYIQQGVDVASPYVKEAVKATADVAGPAIQKAVPIVQETLTGAIKAGGIDLDAVKATTETVAKTATDGAVAAKPVLEQLWQFLSTSSPVQLAEYGAGGFALYLLSPAILGAFLGGLRGYGGDINAVAALEAISQDGNTVIVDIRTAREKEASGVPDVPGGGSKLVEVEFAGVEDRKLRGSLRDAGFVEAQITALQISALKRIGRGSKVLLLDRNGSTSRTIAKELAKLGFSRVFVIDGGFDGRNGWVQSKLLVKPVAGSGFAALPSITRTVSTRGLQRSGSRALDRTQSGTRRSLPAPRQ